MNFQEFLIQHTLRMYDKEKKIFPNGHNGLYEDPETPLRNNAHFLCILNYLYENGWNEAKNLIHPIMDYIDNYEGSFNYQFRIKNGKDSSNGLIGIAWLIEGVSCSLQNNLVAKTTIERITNILSNYNMDENKGVWINRFEPNGKILGIDRTLNHQIWFTAMLAKLNKYLNNKELHRKINCFINHFNKTRKLNQDGLYYHTLNYRYEYYKTYMRRILKNEYRKEMRIKEVGYHSFNLLGLHLLNNYTKLSLFKKYKKDLSALKITNNSQYLNSTYGNPYGYPYNPIGFEHAVVQSFHLDIFKKDDILRNINEQFRLWDPIEKKMISIDSNTSNARMYEMTYINQEIINNLYFDMNRGEWYLN